MYSITELIASRESPPLACLNYVRVFFSIYYKVPDHAFKRAAETWKLICRQQEFFIPGYDQFIEKEVHTEEEFNIAWMQINIVALQCGGKVWAGNIFSHASKQEDSEDGLEFISGGLNDGTLKKTEIKGLVKLPWSEYGYLILSGCNTGLVNKRGWAPASAFAFKQGVPTLGQIGYAYFSKNGVPM